MLRAWEVADELGWARVAFDMRPGLGSGRRIGIDRGGLGRSSGTQRPYSGILETTGEVSRRSRRAEVQDGDAWV